MEKDINGKYYINFDGTNDYAQINELEASIDFLNGFTVEFEAEWSALNSWSRIMDFGNGQNSNNIAIGNRATTGNIYAVLRGSTTHDLNTGVETSIGAKNKYKIEFNRVNSGYNISTTKNNDNAVESTTSVVLNNILRSNNYLGKSNWTSDSYFKGKIYSLKITLANGDVVLWYDINQWINDE